MRTRLVTCVPILSLASHGEMSFKAVFSQFIQLILTHNIVKCSACYFVNCQVGVIVVHEVLKRRWPFSSLRKSFWPMKLLSCCCLGAISAIQGCTSHGFIVTQSVYVAAIVPELLTLVRFKSVDVTVSVLTKSEVERFLITSGCDDTCCK